MMKASSCIDTADEFFERARRAARKADHGEPFLTSAAHLIEGMQHLPKAASEIRELLSLKAKCRRAKQFT